MKWTRAGRRIEASASALVTLALFSARDEICSLPRRAAVNSYSLASVLQERVRNVARRHWACAGARISHAQPARAPTCSRNLTKLSTSSNGTLNGLRVDIFARNVVSSSTVCIVVVHASFIHSIVHPASLECEITTKSR